MTNEVNTNSICCPEFEPAIWDDKIIRWDNKQFIKDSVFTILYMPICFSKTMVRLDNKVRKANANIPDWLCLSEHTSMWNMKLFLAVDKEIPDADNTTLSGSFYCKVYEGPYKDSGKWMKDFNQTAAKNGHKIEKSYIWYTTCPKCAKKHGKNYVAIFGQLK
jgi:hypothetical protein